MEDDNQVSTLGLGEISAIAWRRRYWLLLPLLIGTVAALVVALTAQPIYQSTAALLIESPQVPTTLVASPFESHGDERIAKIRQQILSRSNLIDLIQRHNLYPDERRTKPMDEVLALMREAVSFDLVSATNAVANAGREGNATIAFNLSYNYVDPILAHRVAEQLTRMFLAEDRRLRTEQASGTAAFMSRRAEELRRRLVDLETKRRAIRSRYSGALPDQVMASTQSSATLRAEVSRIDAETQGIMQQNSLLAARSHELANAPDLTAEAEVRRARAELDRLIARYSDTYPEVLAARSVLARAEVAAQAAPRRSTSSAAIEAEIQAGRARIAMLSRRRAELVAAVADAERRVSMSPQAAYELSNLERDYDNLNLQYQDIREKQLEVQVAANLQAEDRGERFSVTDPPSFPHAPLSPNRVMLVLLGIAGGLGAGIVIILAHELVSGAIHGPSAIARLTGEPPLVCITVLEQRPAPARLTRFDRAMPWLRRRGVER